MVGEITSSGRPPIVGNPVIAMRHRVEVRRGVLTEVHRHLDGGLGGIAGRRGHAGEWKEGAHHDGRDQA